MVLPVWMDNLFAYSLQMAILASAGTLLAYLFRLRMPHVSLVYWQVLLFVCLVLPVLQNWNHPIQSPTISTTETVVYEIPKAVVAAPSRPLFSITPETIGLVLGAGICLRLLWLALGFFRLRLFLGKAQLLSGAMPVSDSLFSRIGVRVRFFLSHEIDSPATVGLFSPIVILPHSFSGMSEACREAVVCHELLHVRRRDWAYILVEEIIRALFWFHPAVWWLLGRIHLAREQSVDHEVVQLTGSRQPYLNSLLEIARLRGRPKAVPASLFLRERHLVQRVALLMKEVSMNRIRLAASLAGITVLLAGTVRIAVGWFPLTGEPKIVRQQPAGFEETHSVRDSINPTTLVAVVAHPPVAAPQTNNSAAASRHVSGEGTHPVNNSINPTTFVRVVADAPTAASQASDSADTASLASEAETSAAVPAAPAKEPLTVGDAIQESRLIYKVNPIYPPLAIRARVMGSVGLKIAVNEEGLVTDVQVIDGHPLLTDAAVNAVRQWRYSPTTLNGKPVSVIATVTVVFNLGDTPPPNTIGGNNPDIGSKLIRRVEPVYPELAKRSRVSGKVILEISVNEEGVVTDAQAIDGHPLLNDAAVDAVRQWKYSPTLMNGKPVPVKATVTVVFRLGGTPLPPPPMSLANPEQIDITQLDGLGGAVIFHAGPAVEKNSSDTGLFHAPEFEMSQGLFQQWHRIAEAGWPANMARTAPVVYRYNLNEAGVITQFVKVAGPAISGLEREMAGIRFISPGHRGSTPISTWCVIQIRLQPGNIVGGIPGGVSGGVSGGVPGGVVGGIIGGKKRTDK
jgi:TonB family protein